eukprot:gene42814-52316_t
MGNSDFDHIGIVVEDPETHELFLLEANVNGVTVFNLHERIIKSKATVFAVRKMMGDRALEFRRNLWKLAQQYQFRKYNSNMFSLIEATVASYNLFFSEGHNLALEHRALEGQLLLLRQMTSQLTSASYLGPLVQQRILQIQSQLNLLDQRILSISQQFEASQSSSKKESKYFCSELVAEVLMELNAFSKTRLSGHFIPADFSSASIVPVLTSSMRDSKTHRYAADIIVRKAHIDHMQKNAASAGDGANGGSLTLSLSPPSSQPLKVRLNVGDLFPVSLLGPYLAQGAVAVAGDVQVLGGLGAGGAPPRILGILRSPINPQTCSSLLQMLSRQYPDLVLQAEARSVITIAESSTSTSSSSSSPSSLTSSASLSSTLSSSPSVLGSSLASQQALSLLQEAWESVWRGLGTVEERAATHPSHAISGKWRGGSSSKDAGVMKICEHVLRLTLLSTPALHKDSVADLWELFVELLQIEHMALPLDPFSPRHAPLLHSHASPFTSAHNPVFELVKDI